MHNQIEAARLSLQKGAEINAIPPGFHYPGTGLHNAAAKGNRAMVEVLLDHGADANAKDKERGGSPASWAAYGGHEELATYLDQFAASENGSADDARSENS